MSIGLDLNTAQFRSLRNVDEELVGRQCRAVYVTLSDTAGHRRLLEQAETQFAPCGDDLVLLGDAALEWADMLNLPLISLLPNGRVPQSDPVARQILTLMIDAVLPTANRLGETCCLTIPGGHDLSRTHQPYDVRFFQQLVALRGYQPRLISPGLALVLAELADASFSGIGAILDSADCQFTVVHCGRELASCSVSGLADSLLQGLEDASALASRQSHLLSGDEISLAQIEKSLHPVLTMARDELIRDGAIHLLSQPVQVACAGEATTTEDFLNLLTRSWKLASWPVGIGRIRVASDPVYSVARGCLIQARLESHDAKHRAA